MQNPVVQRVHLLPVAIHPDNLKNEMADIQRSHGTTGTHPRVNFSDEAEVAEDEDKVDDVDGEDLENDCLENE